MRKALTLAELLLAAAMLALVCSMLFMLFANCIILNESSRNLSVATAHAQYVMEEIKNEDFPNIKSNIDNGNWDWSISAVEAQGLTALEAESINTEEIGADSELLDVMVTVNWQDRAGRARDISLETLIVEP